MGHAKQSDKEWVLLVARYVFNCEDCGEEVSEQHAMGTAPLAMECPSCGGCSSRDWQIQFNQDMRRFRTGKSQATGEPYAQSRAEERRIEKERGISFVGRNDLTPKEKHLASYAKHVREGGERVASDVINPPEKVQRKTVQQVMREKNVRLG